MGYIWLDSHALCLNLSINVDIYLSIIAPILYLDLHSHSALAIQEPVSVPPVHWTPVPTTITVNNGSLHTQQSPWLQTRVLRVVYLV